MSNETDAADPAQSAPSAERLIDEHRKAAIEAPDVDWSAEKLVEIITGLVADDGSIGDVSRQDAVFAVYRYEATRNRAYAALRTAQLERELQESDKEGDDILKAYNDVTADLAKMTTHAESLARMVDEQAKRAETAESALAEARELAIKECAEICDNRVKQLTSHTDKYPEGSVAANAKPQRHEAKVISKEIRALLTVAAQTPEEK